MKHGRWVRVWVRMWVLMNLMCTEWQPHGCQLIRTAMSSVWFSNLRSLFMRARAALRPSRTKSKPSQGAARCTVARCTIARCTIVAAMLHFECRAAQRVVLAQEINLNKPNRNFANNRGLACNDGGNAGGKPKWKWKWKWKWIGLGRKFRDGVTRRKINARATT